ncbi:hypothetical protein C3K47_09120 [Solitalea longa]|uniref:HMA domain-containing protein n=1 Tax=Solitalea longa TaxID=2079460 RepID=A0A2S5A2J4_9SPHI|nr:hypothetical protein [Solitalea longa]POY36529.1 hypothetical protein C3K47_09120 [Solitalea longa]
MPTLLQNRTIHIFKTNINDEPDVKAIASSLNDFSDILKWNVAIDDCDKILRIESSETEPEGFIRLINTLGYACEELNF